MKKDWRKTYIKTRPLPKPRRPCMHCSDPSVPGRAYCVPCLRRLETTGCVDLDEYPTSDDAKRSGAPDCGPPTLSFWGKKRDRGS